MKPGRFHRALVVAVYCFLLSPAVFVTLISFSAENFISFPPSGWSLRWYAALWDHALLMTALRVSLFTAVIVTALALLLGTPAAFAIARGRFPGREALFAGFTAPLILPTVVLGLALLLALTSFRLTATYQGLVLGHLAITVPFVIRILTTAFANLPPDVEDAASTLGAKPFQVFRRVTLPLIAPGLVAASALSFLLSFDETVITLFLSGPRLSTLPVEVFRYVERRTDPMIAALSVVLIATTVVVVVIVERMVGVLRAVGR
jgi:putative spermidine/putrescine transport system permease protein